MEAQLKVPLLLMEALDMEATVMPDTREMQDGMSTVLQTAHIIAQKGIEEEAPFTTPGHVHKWVCCHYQCDHCPCNKWEHKCPTDRLPKEIPNMRVWTFGYDSAWFGQHHDALHSPTPSPVIEWYSYNYRKGNMIRAKVLGMAFDILFSAILISGPMVFQVCLHTISKDTETDKEAVWLRRHLFNI